MDDKTLIQSHGGPAALARKLGYDVNKGGTQRVQNWLARGIPAQVKLDHPEIFQVIAPAARKSRRRKGRGKP